MIYCICFYPSYGDPITIIIYTGNQSTTTITKRKLMVIERQLDSESYIPLSSSSQSYFEQGVKSTPTKTKLSTLTNTLTSKFSSSSTSSTSLNNNISSNEEINDNEITNHNEIIENDQPLSSLTNDNDSSSKQESKIMKSRKRGRNNSEIKQWSTYDLKCRNAANPTGKY